MTESEDESTTNLPIDDDTEELVTDELLKMASIYTSAKKTLNPTIDDIYKLSETENISFEDAKTKLLKEARANRAELIEHAIKLRNKRLSKKIRQQLGVKEAGRPKGSKNKADGKFTKPALEAELKKFILSYYESEGEEPTQEMAAEALDLGYAKKLRLLRHRYGDNRDWRELVADVIANHK